MAELASDQKKAAVALYDVKADMGANRVTIGGEYGWMNLLGFNLFGDIEMRIG